MLSLFGVREALGYDAFEEVCLSPVPAGLDSERGRDVPQFFRELGLICVYADARDQDSFLGGLDHYAGELTSVQHHVVGPADVAVGVDGSGYGQAERHGQDRKDMVEAGE